MVELDWLRKLSPRSGLGAVNLLEGPCCSCGAAAHFSGGGPAASVCVRVRSILRGGAGDDAAILNDVQLLQDVLSGEDS